MDAQTAQKIQEHKVGRRKLATDSAWSAWNRKARNKDGKFTEFLQSVAGDSVIQGDITGLNQVMHDIFAVYGGSISTNAGTATIEFSAPDKMFIPRSVWYGYINMPTGGLTADNRTTFGAKEKEFADRAGHLRARLAILTMAQSALNDLGNSGQKPNPGGPVGA